MIKKFIYWAWGHKIKRKFLFLNEKAFSLEFMKCLRCGEKL